MISIIADCTDRNDHNEAILIASSFSKHKEEFEKRILKIKTEHNKLGYMSKESLKEREIITDEVRYCLKKELSEDLFDKIWSAL